MQLFRRWQTALRSRQVTNDMAVAVKLKGPGWIFAIGTKRGRIDSGSAAGVPHGRCAGASKRSDLRAYSA